MKIKNLIMLFNRLRDLLFSILSARVYVGRYLSRIPDGSIIFFPAHHCLLRCGLAGIVAFKPREKPMGPLKIAAMKKSIKEIAARGFRHCRRRHYPLNTHYLGGRKHIDALWAQVREFKRPRPFCEIFQRADIQAEISETAAQIHDLIVSEESQLAGNLGLLDTAEVAEIVDRLEKMKDAHWCLTAELINNIKKTKDLLHQPHRPHSTESIAIFREINAVLNSLDRLEVRGRDSAGISLMFILSSAVFKRFEKALKDSKLLDQLRERSRQDVLINQGLCIQALDGRMDPESVSISITYKIAAEVGNLGDNIFFLRRQIKNDLIFQLLTTLPLSHHTVLSHTRWASVGAITEANCHPVDNCNPGEPKEKKGRIYVCLNGDIDNYQDLKNAYEKNGGLIHPDITTDTKIIPLQIEKYYQEGNCIEEAFRLAVNDFEGSHAISMHTDFAPGKLFLAQKGSGQAIFIGLSDDYFMPTSEVYGFIEETPYYLKIEGEKVVRGRNGKTQGQIFILDQKAAGGLDGIEAIFYDGTPVALDKNDIKETEITTRDTDRQGFSHYFLKEISESSVSVEKTLQGRWKINRENEDRYEISLDEKVVPPTLKAALANHNIRRIYFVGQGTAGVAAQVCSNILEYYLGDPSFYTRSLKSSELSGFKLNENDGKDCLDDTLVIAITQSGTTTDTNRTIDMVKERGAHTIAIVNRRDSDITFKVDGVMYTSSGRDIEMSVASTKAFYSQIIAGALLSLYITHLKGRKNDRFVSDEIQQMLELPKHMRSVLTLRGDIEKSAQQHAAIKTYWAAVGSGPNKAAADEIRIKLSELCYKTISSDFIEDKKHIDLSSEPLIIVCAAGTRGNVIGDIIKDTAIFQAHKATPIVIADEGEEKFDSYAADVFHVPLVAQHFAPILNTLAGHLWGYYAALAINEGSQFFYNFQKKVQDTVREYSEKGLDVYEIVLENNFREMIAQFYSDFKTKKEMNRFPTALVADAASNLTLLLKYLSGRLPLSDFELDFGKKGTALNMLNSLFECTGEAINRMVRPIDAIKHQAKTVTVGTSRISEKIEGILFEALAAHNCKISQLTNNNIIVLKNLQGIVSRIQGAILYRIAGLNILGELTDQTAITVIKKEGSLKPLPSRVETDATLKGTKRIIVRQGNVYIGKGRKDDRSIVVIPILSEAPDRPNIIEYLLLLHIAFKTDVSLPVKIRALGGKLEHIKNIVQENSITWEDKHLERIDMEKLFGVSAEKIGEFIVAGFNGSAIDPDCL